MNQCIKGAYDAPRSETLELTQENCFLATNDNLTPKYGSTKQAGDDLLGGESYEL